MSLLPAQPALRPALEPDWAFWVYPKSAISNRRIDAFVIADLLADVIEGSPSSSGGYYISSAEGGQWNDWQRLNNDLSISNCGFGRFLDSGQWQKNVGIGGVGSSLGSGMYLLPKSLPLTASVGSGAFPSGDGGALGWQSVAGSWNSVPRLEAKGANAVMNKGADTNASIQTAKIPQGQPLHLDLQFLAQNKPGVRAGATVRLGPNLRIGLYEGIPPLLESATTTYTEQGGARVATQKWGCLKAMEAAGEFSPLDTRYQMSVHHIGGRLVWTVNGHSVHLIDSDDKGGAKAIVWGGAALRVDTQGVRARVETHMLSHKGVTGTVKRRISKKSAAGQTLSTPRAGGHIPKGTSIEIATVQGDDYIEYTATMKSSDATGVFTPLLSQICLVQTPVWVSGNVAGTNISAAVTSASVNHAHPPLQAGTEGQMEVDIPLLRKLFPQSANFIADYCPVEVSARWRDGGGQPIGDYRGLMRGYLFGTRGDEPRYNDGKLAFTLRDPIVRLREPAAVVAGRTAPLDIAFMDQMDNASPDWRNTDATHSVVPDPFGSVVPVPNRDKQWFDVQCVQNILEQFLGPEVAASLNDGNLFQFLPPDHPPLLDYNTLRVAYAQVAEAFGVSLSGAALANQNGFIFEPPYKSDALSWINKFCADMFCTFFYGYATRDHNGWPIPLYGRYDLMMKRAKLFQVARGELENLSTETRPERDYNGVWFLGNDFDSKIPLAPSLNQGEARLPYGHPNSQYASWERLKVLESNLAISPSSAMVAAAIALAEMDNNGEISQWPTYTFRGDNKVQVGDVFWTNEARMLNVNDLWFRAPKLSHVYKCDPSSGRSWGTTASLQRMSRSQTVAFCRANNLPISM